MDTVRLGIVGLGNMGKAHLANIRAGKVPGLNGDSAVLPPSLACSSLGSF